MKTINPARSVLVLDLDDTLYSEFEYKVSGIRALIRLMTQLYPERTEQELHAAVDVRKNDWLDRLCAHCGFNESEKQSLLWQYRLHRPEIKPYLPAEEFAGLVRDFAATALISDGRSLTQRLKLDALGLTEYFDDILISETYASEKPDALRFELIERKYAAQDLSFIYVGDNIKKDFVTPKRMGWLTIGLTASPDNIHVHHPDDFEPEYHPELWLDSLSRLTDLMSK